jgi:metal-responsive CopG/Arc/MetJ family transcriptional regulator
MKENTTKINVTLPSDLVEKIKENNYNRNQLIVSLLKKHIENKQK